MTALGAGRRPVRPRLGRTARARRSWSRSSPTRAATSTRVFAANDNLAQQAINALEAAGVGPVPISGQDASAAGIQNILLGKQTMTIYKPIEPEAGLAAAIALALRAGEDILTTQFDFEYDLVGIGTR